MLRLVNPEPLYTVLATIPTGSALLTCVWSKAIAKPTMQITANTKSEARAM